MSESKGRTSLAKNFRRRIALSTNKQRPAQVWKPVIRSEGEERVETGKIQKVSSVFDRLSDPSGASASPAKKGR
jgi:hypothetical protein